MADRTSIEWTETTWNPVTGCSAASAGCDNCYAERLALRLQRMGNPRYDAGFEVQTHADLVDRPRSWTQPRLVFVNSMSDLFHPKVPTEFIEKVFKTMQETPRHTYQVLTKRPKRARVLAKRLPWPDNVWMGVSVEDQRVCWRVDVLRDVPARTRFLSCEPLIGDLDLNLDGIDWVIVGGESGPHARPMEVGWVRSVRDQCEAAGVPFFFKQWGGPTPKARGRLLDEREWSEFPMLIRRGREEGVA